MKILVVGLGNVGEQYSKTRHNIGWMFLDTLHNENNHDFSNWRTCHKNCESSVGSYLEHTITLLKPLTMMNNSGDAVKNMLDYCTYDAVIVVHDEMDIPFGDVRKKFGGSRADHRGLRDVVRAMETHDFYRIRCGIGRPENNTSVLEHVLSNFSNVERESIELFISNITITFNDILNSI